MSEATTPRYEPIVISSESTVVSEFLHEIDLETAYQSEAKLEEQFIKLLRDQAYEYVKIPSEEELKANLRSKLETLNHISFSDNEWTSFFNEKLIGRNEGIEEKTRRIQEEHIQELVRDDGSTKNIILIDKANIHNNQLQVINQYEVNKDAGGAARSNRYDVTILVNGFPLVHIELKRRGVNIREAFNQIDRYQRESFWAGSGLFDYVQLFVISNGTLTKYYSNTTRRQHLGEATGANRSRAKKTSNSFEFTSWWADANNNPIKDLVGFTKTFFAKHTLLNILVRYCVLTADSSLLVMRPYQIVATERILQRIKISINSQNLGKTLAGGYIWHTTGSGKTLTSFKSAQLASRVPEVKKVLFVVDRKDLDYQTMREYDRFEKGAANSNKSTAILKKQLENPDVKIIITTIQKLTTFTSSNKNHPIYGQHVVLIFDECHRSQFGQMHTSITHSFKCYNIFGFTGTPIFTVNASKGENPNLRTTEQAFGDKLHTYTIVDAITDKNVLPFRIDYINTVKVSSHLTNKQVSAIDTEGVLLAPERISQVVSYILQHFSQKTKRAESYRIGKRHIEGFNALLATASIEAAKRYYAEFKRQQQDLASDKKLKVGIIFSYPANEEVTEDFIDAEGFETDALEQSSRNFLDNAINDYNTFFGTSFDTSSDKFQNYYKDLSLRLKNQEIDLVIVVNMFLTGFDATTLNTLFLDKRLINHGLLQAYSRTNRILNSVKTYGNIVSFRDLEQETNDAIALFGNKDAHSVILLKPYNDYYQEYARQSEELLTKFPLNKQIVGETAQKEFVTLFNKILKSCNILTSFDEFEGKEILSDKQSQDYRSIYLDFYTDSRQASSANKEPINDDVVFEIELIKQVEINVDYILMLVQRWRESNEDHDKKAEAKTQIERAVNSSVSFHNKKDLIMAFVDSISANEQIDEKWLSFVEAKYQEELDQIIKEKNLDPQATIEYMKAAFEKREVSSRGTSFAKIHRISRFSVDNDGQRAEIVASLSLLLDRFIGIRKVS